MNWYELEARLTAEVSERLLDLAGIGPGMRVLDLATGKGEPLVRIAERVGASGLVVGVDPWVEALEVTRARVAALGNVTLQPVGAEAFEAPDGFFDAATSRWGLFSVPNPVVALQRVQRALKPGAPVVAALWAEYERIPWYSLAREVTSEFLALPPLTSAPGPLRLATPEQVERVYAGAELEIVEMEEMECTVVEALDIVDWVRYFWGRWVDLLEPARVPQWEDALRRASEAYRMDGLVRLGGVTRLVVGR